jgi:hypothetical protein
LGPQILVASKVFTDSQPDDGLLELGIVTADGLVEWTRTLARTAAGTPTKSPFVLTTKARSVEIELNRKVATKAFFGALDEMVTSWVLSGKNYDLTQLAGPVVDPAEQVGAEARAPVAGMDVDPRPAPLVYPRPTGQLAGRVVGQSGVQRQVDGGPAEVGHDPVEALVDPAVVVQFGRADEVVDRGRVGQGRGSGGEVRHLVPWLRRRRVPLLHDVVAVFEAQLRDRGRVELEQRSAAGRQADPAGGHDP